MPENGTADAKGERMVLGTVALDPAQKGEVATRFRADRDDAYGGFLGKGDDIEREVARVIALGSAFAASLIEVAEAFAIVLVVATLSGRGPALRGTAATVAATVPIGASLLVVGELPLRGLGWQRKA